MGGPTRNYYDNENYAYTLSVPSGSLAQLQFISFGTELNYDTLWLYNGASTSAAALIGSYTGTNSPGIKVSTSNSITVRFKSDGATTSFGFKAMKSCITPSIATGFLEWADHSIQVYPNPTSDKVTFKNCSLAKVYDSTGKLLVNVSSMEPITNFDFGYLGTGLYFAEVVTPTHSKKILKIIVSSN
jgi:hypothetical protein